MRRPLVWAVLVFSGLVLSVLVIEVTRSGAPDSRATVGRSQTVFRWTSDACEPLHFPDAPARAFRAPDGRVRLSISHYDTRFMVGPALDDLSVGCEAAFTSSREADPSRYNDHEWLTSFYVVNDVVLGLVHNEFHGHRHGPCPSGRYWYCWYNAITSARSTDGGVTFEQRPPPDHMVAAPPERYRADSGPSGIFSPSNIVRRGNGYHFLARYRRDEDHQGVCLFRTETPLDADSWRAWDGQAFRQRLASPYGGRNHRTGCRLIDPEDLGHGMSNSILWNTRLQRFVLVGMSDRSGVWGIHYSTSENMLEWSIPQLLLEAQRAENYQCAGPPRLEYPSLIDATSESDSFDTMDGDASLYFVRFNYPGCDVNTGTPNPGHDRDLVRVPFTIRKR